jgi:Sigma-70, region 4
VRAGQPRYADPKAELAQPLCYHAHRLADHGTADFDQAVGCGPGHLRTGRRVPPWGRRAGYQQPDGQASNYRYGSGGERCCPPRPGLSQPARQREVIVLRYYADLSVAQIARVTENSNGAVQRHAARAMAALRQVLESADQ